MKGPDKGKTQSFTTGRVTIGDDVRNDFKLHDRMVSRFHGELEVFSDDVFVYRDLGSRNGSYILCGKQRHNLHNRNQTQSVELDDKAQVALGQTLLQVDLWHNIKVNEPNISSTTVPKVEPEAVAVAETFDSAGFGSPQSLPPEVAAADTLDGSLKGGARQTNTISMRESIVRRILETDAERISTTTSSERLQVLFRVARQLNGLNELDQILNRVAAATFEMFPLANFFTVAVPNADTGQMTPLICRLRDGEGDKELILSQSLLREVVEKRESILYVRDNLSKHDARKSIVMAQITACLAAPLLGQRKLMGVMQVDSRGRNGMFGYDALDLFTLLASSAAFAMERSELTRNIQEMFEAFVHASVVAIDSRDPTTAGHSQRVADYTMLTARHLNSVSSGVLSNIFFSPEELTELRYAALLHDFGKIGVREEILQKPSRLMPQAYRLVVQRFDTYKTLRQAEIYKAFHDKLLKDGRPPTAEDLIAVDRAVIAEMQRIQHYRNLIDELQQPGFLKEEQKALVHEIAKISFIGPSGHVQSLLTEEDVVNLTIRAGTLNESERRHIESHAGLSRDYLSRIPWREDLAQIPCIAGNHHEKLDGSGYPRGIPAEDILPQVRILTICDIFDALTATDRPYKKARSAREASDILLWEAEAGKLDGDLVQLFNTDIVPQLLDQLGPGKP